MNKKTEVATLTADQLALLNQNFPVSDEQQRLSLPKFGMISKDLTEETGTGKNKKITVVQAAGTFYTERDKGEVNEEGKKVWTKDYIEGETVDVIIGYHRKQLRFFDKSLKKFISTPIYDNDEQVLPLYLDKQIIKRGTEKELQALYPKLTQKGKPSSSLEKNIILYVLYEGELYQFQLSVSAGWEFKSYLKKVNPSTVVTTLSSTQETNGSNTYNKTMFNIARQITGKEFDTVIEIQDLMRTTAETDARFLIGSGEQAVVDKAFEEIDLKDIPF